MHLIPIQFLLLAATSAGWAYWLKRLLKIDSAWNLSLATLLFGAGFASQILLLQNLVYLDMPVGTTFLAPAAAGLYGLYLAWKELPPIEAGDRYRAIGVLVVVFLIQAAAVFVETPNHYYGKGSIDQFNYTIMSEFMLSQPFHSTEADLHLQPWMTRAHEFKTMRIGQAVAQAYTAALSFSSAKEAFGPLSAFCLGLLALFTYSLARALAVSPNLAVLAALWTGIAPAMTRYHLEGFLSQTVSLFVAPMLILWARTTSKKWGYAVAIPAIALSYLLVCYVEMFPVILVLFGGLALYRARVASVNTLTTSAAAAAISLVLVPLALTSSYKFMRIQMVRAEQRHSFMEIQAPLAGTIPGWIQGLAWFPVVQFPLELLTAITILGLAGFAIYRFSTRNRLFVLAMLLPPVLVLGYLLANQPLAKYPFAKIQDSFAFLWILVAVLGLSRLRSMLPDQRILFAVPLLLLPFAAIGTARHNYPVFNHLGTLQSYYMPGVQESIAYAESHPGQTYLVKSTDRNAAAWIAYAARGSKAYLSPPRLADLTVTRNAYEFTRVPDHVPGMILLSNSGVRGQDGTLGAPTLEVFNPQGEERSPVEVWYWLGKNLEIEINRWDSDARPVEYKLKVKADPGPSHPSLYRKMRLSNSRTGITQDIEVVVAGQSLTIPLTLAPGRNQFLLELIEPTDGTVTIAQDPRKLMVRLTNPGLTDPKPIEKPDAELAKALAAGIPAAPAIKLINPQSSDTAGGATWYWVAKDMEVLVDRTDGRPEDHVYSLTFRAQPGFANPNPVRNVRVTHAETGTETNLKVVNAGTQAIMVNLKAGANRFKLEIVDNLPQLLKSPGDPRIHMLRVEDFNLRYLGTKMPEPAAPPKPAAAKAAR